jgi:hypothetical protein
MWQEPPIEVGKEVVEVELQLQVLAWPEGQLESFL